MIAIRQDNVNDAAGVRQVNLHAFGGRDEADLVERLRVSCPDAISLVAEDESQVVGHIIFSPVVIESGNREIAGLGLGPMSVLPGWQRQGIGLKLVSFGLEAARSTGVPFVVVLGHPEYYPRFDFVPASRYGISCEFNVPDDVFMILLLDEDSMVNVAGIAKYGTEFDAWK